MPTPQEMATALAAPQAQVGQGDNLAYMVPIGNSVRNKEFEQWLANAPGGAHIQDRRGGYGIGQRVLENIQDWWRLHNDPITQEWQSRGFDPRRLGMADNAPEGMRIPLPRINQTLKQELSGGGGGGGTKLDQIRALQAEKEAAEAWRKRITQEPAAGNFWTPEKVQQLQELRTKGTPVMDMAHELGTTKGSIVGKLNRLRGYLSENQLKAKGIEEPPVSPRQQPSLPRLKFLEKKLEE